MLKQIFKKYVLDALSHMAQGLFCSLIMGLIVGQIAKIPGLEFLDFIAVALSASSPLVGACIGLAIARGLSCALLVTVSSAVVGALGYQFGGPVGAYLAVILGCEAGGLVTKKTPVDIIVTPLVTIVVGGLFARYCCSPINDFMLWTGSVINEATRLSPFLMGVAVSVLVGCTLTLPISSVALCVMLGIDGFAAGAATVGCCAQMVGFADISYSDNGVGGLLSQGVGTSMLLKMTNTALGAGMGTAGLIGPISTYASMTEAGASPMPLMISIICLYFIAPAVISLAINLFMKKRGWIKPGDMKLDL